MLVTTWVGRFL